MLFGSCSSSGMLGLYFVGFKKDAVRTLFNLGDSSVF